MSMFLLPMSGNIERKGLHNYRDLREKQEVAKSQDFSSTVERDGQALPQKA